MDVISKITPINEVVLILSISSDRLHAENKKTIPKYRFFVFCGRGGFESYRLGTGFVFSSERAPRKYTQPFRIPHATRTGASLPFLVSFTTFTRLRKGGDSNPRGRLKGLLL